MSGTVSSTGHGCTKQTSSLYSLKGKALNKKRENLHMKSTNVCVCAYVLDDGKIMETKPDKDIILTE